jgi:hypothetical protein
MFIILASLTFVSITAGLMGLVGWHLIFLVVLFQFYASQ